MKLKAEAGAQKQSLRGFCLVVGEGCGFYSFAIYGAFIRLANCSFIC